ncbi:MAG: DUF885 domain-containing protein [Gammaproteobacteria bacterium]|nr:MAG: DUF885 domain-containing protein [Gammaproteobacteria bacterium]
MRSLFKWLGIGVTSVVVLVIIVAAWAWWGPLPKFDWAVNRAVLKTMVQSPETLSQMRILEPLGITFHQDELDDESPEAGDRAIAQMRKIIAELKSYDRDKMTDQEKLTYDIVMWMADLMEEQGEKWRYYNYPVNQLFGVQNNFPSFMESAHQIHSVSDAEDYIARLRKVGWKFDGVLQGLKIREEKNIIPPTFIIDKVLEEMRNFVGTEPKENVLYTSFVDKLNKAGISGAERDQLTLAVQNAIVSDVYPAYQKLIDYMQGLREKSTPDAGVWKFADGDAFYRAALKMMTTTDMSPDEIHQLGLAEVERIQGEMRKILTAEGYDPNVPVGTLMRQLNEEPRFLYPDTDEGRAQILRDYSAIIDEVNTKLSPWFGVRPKAPVEVKRVPQFKEKTAPGAYYEPPAMDGSRPGTFYANLYDIKATPKFNMRTLAYHEAVPGHHFQIAIALEQKDLPLLRRMMPMPAFAEGWALYAERLAWEAGLQENPYDNLGRLQAELFRAVRLVVDTGIHAKRWTREQAIEYMEKTTGMAHSDVVAEIERYIVMPGQACAYKIGMMKILELRERARQALGERFDIRAFHDLILKNGAMPLMILERVVDQWIADQTAQGKNAA